MTDRSIDSRRCQSTSVDKEQQQPPPPPPKPKQRNLLDNASNLLTNFLSGGGLGAMPVAEGAVTDLFGKPLFFSLYDWFIQVNARARPLPLSPPLAWASLRFLI